MLTQQDIKALQARWDEAFTDDLFARLDKYASLWGIQALALLCCQTANAVFACTCPQGPAILKIGRPNKEWATEAAVLRQYGGKGMCRLYSADAEQAILLEERVAPGTTLWAEPDGVKRAAVFCGVFRGLHQPAENPAQYPTYLSWLQGVEKYAPALRPVLHKAQSLCSELYAAHPGGLLLHGDMHQENILKSTTGYTVIDPKGVVGPAVMDTARFLLNELFETPLDGATRRRLRTTIAALSAELRYTETLLCQCLYIDTVLSCAWHLESKTGELPHLQKRIAFVEALLA